jgi:hypothetical protein
MISFTISRRPMRSRVFAAATISAFWLAASSSHAGTADALPAELTGLERIEVQPERIELRSPRERAMILVTGRFADGRVVDLSRRAQFQSSDSAIAELREGAIYPTGDGQCEVVIQFAGHSAASAVAVTDFDQPAPISFRTETVAALTRQGCNSGGCHGAPSGKGGFSLSLQAYDHALDEQSLTRSEEGRRINAIEPAQSLLLLKPTMVVPHRGGLQLRTTDYAYDVLRSWIAEGARVDAAEGKRCVRLELLPASGRVLTAPHRTQQVVARAHFDDGTVRDVTQLTKFSSSNEALATIDGDGLLVGQGRGQVAVMARYLDQLVSCQFTLVEPIEGFAWPGLPANNYIDELVGEKLQQLQFEPAELCSDEEFVRRATLDVIGRLPTTEEQDAFLQDPSDDRRLALVNRLLESPEYAEFWALKWADLLRLRTGEVSEAGVHKFHRWLVDAFADNMPLDQFARELLTAQGSTYDRPPANYYRSASDPIKAAETTAQLFLGSRIQCAKCHNHPFENWTQDNFYGLTAFFNRVERKPGSRVDELVVYVPRGGEVHQPRTGQLMKPWLPGVGSIDATATPDRRQAFAKWLTAPGNPFFAQVGVNRVWAEVMGQGIVDPVDDFRQSNPPSIPALLERLAADFEEHGFDQRHMLRTILASRTYQLSSQATSGNKDDLRFFSHAKMRLLSAEQLLDAVCQVTGVQETFAGLPAGTRARQVPSPDFANDFLATFGRPARLTSCACERGSRATLAQVIELFNGTLIEAKLAAPENQFRRLLGEGRPRDEVVTLLYRAAVCRPPNGEELAAALAHMERGEDAAAALEDVCWALLNTDEFLTQH